MINSCITNDQETLLIVRIGAGLFDFSFGEVFITYTLSIANEE